MTIRLGFFLSRKKWHGNGLGIDMDMEMDMGWAENLASNCECAACI